MQKAGLIPAVLTATTDPPSLRVKLISARPLYISTTRDALDVPRLSISEPIPARLNMRILIAGTSARERYCAVLRKAAYSALGFLYMGESGSAFFQSARKSS